MYWFTDPYTLIELLTAVVGVFGLLLFWCLDRLGDVEEQLVKYRREAAYLGARQRRENGSYSHPEPLQVIDNHGEFPIDWRKSINE